MTETTTSDDHALDAAAMLDIAERQQRDVQRRMGAAMPWIMLAWGIAWLVGFGMLWLIDGAAPGFAVPPEVAVVTFIVLMVAALTVSAILGIRMGRGIRSTGDAALIGTIFGLSWPVGFVALYLVGIALDRAGASAEVLTLFYPSAAVFFVGIMYVTAALIWPARQAAAFGAFFLVLAAVAPQFGPPTHFLVFAIAGGAAFFVAGILGAVYGRGPVGWAR